jgi:peptidoglycan/xylan/chitin deacetylase (PgdA/CDA1 family)
VARLVRSLAARLRPDGRGVLVDVPPNLPPRVLRALGADADGVVVMAYDEHDDSAPPGPIASTAFVARALESLDAVPPERRVAGLGIYGYDWNEDDPATPVSFADALAALKEARVLPAWDSSGNLTARYHDEEGGHELWLLDAVTVANQLDLAAARGVGAVALWRLGGEDPGIWRVLDGGAAPEQVPPEERVDNQGDGPFLQLALTPESGRRVIARGDAGAVETWQRLPSPWVVRRAGIVRGEVALTFDDGPDPRFTPAILDTLRARGAPASFFVVGLQAARWPELVQRAFAEGHEIGNHSFTHPDVDRVADWRLGLELEATSRLLETLLGRRALLYRPPSLADVEPRTIAGARAFARAGSLGYLVVDADVDPRDWEEPSADALVERVLADAHEGGVVLLHDGGGDRSTTVAALPRIIDGLRARGLRLAPLGALIGKSRDEVMAAAPLRQQPVARLAVRTTFSFGTVALQFGRVALALALVLTGLRAALMIALALWAERRRRRRRTPLPPVSAPITAIVPAYNEAQVIAGTVERLLRSDVPVEVIVVDDGSSDDTIARVRARFAGDARVRLIAQANQGKAAALRRGFAEARHEIVVALDADTWFAPDTVTALAAQMADPRVGAVAGTAEVGNCDGWLARCQSLEYLVQQEIDRRAWDVFGALPIVPGAVGAWRKSAVEELGGFGSDTLAEDADLAMALCRRGWRVVHAPEARARTEAPETLGALARQRVRWSFGVLQAMWKHRRALVERRAGAFGRLVLPTMIVFQVALPLLTPLALAAALWALACGNWRPAAIASAAFCAIDGVQLVVAAALARRGGGSCRVAARAWLAARFIQRPLLLWVALRSLARVIDGIPLGWGKLARRGLADEVRLGEVAGDAADAQPRERALDVGGRIEDASAVDRAFAICVELDPALGPHLDTGPARDRSDLVDHAHGDGVDAVAPKRRDKRVQRRKVDATHGGGCSMSQ